jgi:hypothetical protein
MPPQIEKAAAAPIDLSDYRFHRQVAHLHRLGVRAVAELLAEIGREHVIRVDIEERLARYARISRAMLRSMGIEP